MCFQALTLQKNLCFALWRGEQRWTELKRRKTEGAGTDSYSAPWRQSGIQGWLTARVKFFCYSGYINRIYYAVGLLLDHPAASRGRPSLECSRPIEFDKVLPRLDTETLCDWKYANVNMTAARLVICKNIIAKGRNKSSRLSVCFGALDSVSINKWRCEVTWLSDVQTRWKWMRTSR